jgi:hypothetical protein
MGWVLFETTESVIEVLWDIALAFFIVRIALVYFLLNFGSGILLSYLAYTQLTPVTHLTTPQSELVLIPFLLLSSALWARFIIASYEIPRAGGFRLATGVVALLMMLAAEALIGFVMVEEGRAEWIYEIDYKAGVAFGLLLLAYTFMPLIQMFFEERVDRIKKTWHGHEEKSVTAAV